MAFVGVVSVTVAGEKNIHVILRIWYSLHL